MILPDLVSAMKTRWNKSFHIERGGDVLFPLGRTFLEELPRRRAVYYPYFTLVKESQQPPLRDFTLSRIGMAERMVSAPALSAHLSSGFTLKVQKLQYFLPSVLDAIDLIETATGAVTTAYAFVTPAQTQGLAYHRDASHVLVHQVEGTKLWHLWEPTVRPPAEPGIVPEPEGILHEFTLEPGDSLYFPYGWVHAANSGPEGSTHVTFTITPPSPKQLLGAYASEEPVATDPDLLVARCLSAIGATR
jgi:hypothetical protein